MRNQASEQSIGKRKSLPTLPDGSAKLTAHSWAFVPRVISLPVQIQTVQQFIPITALLHYGLSDARG